MHSNISQTNNHASVAERLGSLTRNPEVPGSIPSLGNFFLSGRWGRITHKNHIII